MGTDYQYNTDSFFLSGINQNQFKYEVANSSITPSLTNISSLRGIITIVFDSALDAGDKTTLDTLATNHVPSNEFVTPSGEIQTPIEIVDLDDVVFTSIAQITYNANIYNDIIRVKTISSMNSEGTSYTLRLFNVTDNNIVADGTFTNTVSTIVTFDSIQTSPTDEVILELQGKANSSTTYSVKNITICYN